MIHVQYFHQPCEQPGFRTGYSTIYYLQVANQLQAKGNEYNIPNYFAFINYEKAFDIIEFEPLFERLKNQGIDEVYLSTMQKLYIGRQHQFYDSIRTVKN